MEAAAVWKGKDVRPTGGGVTATKSELAFIKVHTWTEGVLTPDNIKNAKFLFDHLQNLL